MDKLLIQFLKQEIKKLKKLYKKRLTESEKIEEYGENEYFGGKLEAYQEALDFIELNKL